MRITVTNSLFFGAMVTVASLGCPPVSAQASATISIFASGLEGPRGLKFGPDGYLYVAEAGTGGATQTTTTQCAQVAAPIGPYSNGNTARISRFDSNGERTTVATGFPSALDATGNILGVADVAFLNGQLYGLISGGGCSHGNTIIPNSVVQVSTTSGAWHVVSNLSQFSAANPALYPKMGDYEPDAVPYNMVASGGRLYVAEANHGQVYMVAPSGATAVAFDVSKAEGHIVPTSIAAKGDRFYVGSLGVFPVTQGSSKILTFTASGCDPLVAGLDPCGAPGALHLAGSRIGLTTVVAVDIGPDGLLYALELNDAAGFPDVNNGKVVRITRAGTIECVVEGLSVPTGMTFGPDGKLYVSNLGAAPPGAGQILRITIPSAH